MVIVGAAGLHRARLLSLVRLGPSLPIPLPLPLACGFSLSLALIFIAHIMSIIAITLMCLGLDNNLQTRDFVLEFSYLVPLCVSLLGKLTCC